MADGASDLGGGNVNNEVNMLEASVHSQAKSGSQTSKIMDNYDQKKREPTVELYKGQTMFARVREIASLREQAQNDFDPSMLTYDDLIANDNTTKADTR